jgi:hypothetical protein
MLNVKRLAWSAIAVMVGFAPVAAGADNLGVDLPPTLSSAWQGSGNYKYKSGLQSNVQELSANTVKIVSGDVVLEVMKPTTVELPLSKAFIARKALVLFKLEDGVEKVMVIWDDGFKTVNLVFGNRKLKLGPGDEAVATGFEPRYRQILEQDDIGHRRVRMHHLGHKNYVTTAEFSLLQALETNPLLSEITRSSDPHDRLIKERIIKTAAVLSFVTRHHGTYSRGGRF